MAAALGVCWAWRCSTDVIRRQAVCCAWGWHVSRCASLSAERRSLHAVSRRCGAAGANHQSNRGLDARGVERQQSLFNAQLRADGQVILMDMLTRASGPSSDRSGVTPTYAIMHERKLSTGVQGEAGRSEVVRKRDPMKGKSQAADTLCVHDETIHPSARASSRR